MTILLLKAFAIGLLVSCPMGPINMLCIQRTLNRGRLHGFVSGLGAMLSDFTYALITVLGLSFVSSFLNDNEQIIRLVGSIVLIGFGFGVFRTNPLKGWSPAMQSEETRYVKDFISSFLLTFSNVAIIVVFITMYARFSFNPVDFGKSGLAIAMLFMLAGQLSWWFFMTFFVSRIRRHFHRKGLIFLNRIVGSIFMAIGLGGLILSALTQ